MPATDNGAPSALDTHLNFETAAEHATAGVPVVGRLERASDVRARLVGQRYESASHVVVCEAEIFLGMMTIEQLLAAAAGATMETLMDREAPVVAPGVDQEVAAWRAVRHGESALAVVDQRRRFVGVIPPHRVVAVLLSEHEEDLSRAVRRLGRGGQSSDIRSIERRQVS